MAYVRRWAAVAAAASLMLGCERSVSGPQMSRVTAYLTDAPAPALASAEVWVSRIYLVGGDSGRVTISDMPQSFDLLQLQGGVTALLGAATIPAGDYAQLRLVVDSARLTLDTGMTFADGSTSKLMKVPSGAQTGIKVDFGGAVPIAPGHTDLVIDFDVSRNFIFTGPPGGSFGVLFTPTLHASVMDVSGSIAGTSLPVAARGHLFAILGTDTVTSALADTVTGAYRLSFLPPGTYTVADSAAGYTTGIMTVTVGSAQNVTGVDFTLTPH